MKKRKNKAERYGPTTTTFLDYKNPTTGILGSGNGVVAIDPGAKGAFAIFWGDLQDKKMVVYPFSSCMSSFFHEVIRKKCRYHVIEKVHAMPGQGVSSMFNFGIQFGRVQAVCEINAESDFYVGYAQPRTWQQYFAKKYNFEIPTGKENQLARKKLLVQIAETEGLSSTIMPLFGEMQDCADAYLILQWTLQFAFSHKNEQT